MQHYIDAKAAGETVRQMGVDHCARRNRCLSGRLLCYLFTQSLTEQAPMRQSILWGHICFIIGPICYHWLQVRVLSPHLLDPKGREQYVAGHAGKGTKWRDIEGTHLHLPMTARPARRLCGLHAMLAIQEADIKGWFSETHEAPKMSEASWQSPTFDHLLMDRYLSDAKAANMHMSAPEGHCSQAKFT